jgi:hypothetical protein
MANDRTEAAGNAILDFVRGLLPAEALEKAGILILMKGDQIEIHNPWQLVVTVKPQDVAAGFIAYAKGQDRLEKWARIVLGGSAFIALDSEFERTRSGEVLLDALWDAAAGEKIAEHALNTARELIASARESRVQ